jgi:hypothetical protein
VDAIGAVIYRSVVGKGLAKWFCKRHTVAEVACLECVFPVVGS